VVLTVDEGEGGGVADYLSQEAAFGCDCWMYGRRVVVSGELYRSDVAVRLLACVTECVSCCEVLG
jgi:hypothetical protein